MASLDLFSLVEAGIFKQPFTCPITELVELTKEHFKSVEWASSFEKDGTIGKVKWEVSHNGVLQALIM